MGLDSPGLPLLVNRVTLFYLILSRLFNDASISKMICVILSGFPVLTRAYDNNGRCPRQKFVFGILHRNFLFRNPI